MSHIFMLLAIVLSHISFLLFLIYPDIVPTKILLITAYTGVLFGILGIYIACSSESQN
jgi:hypothetical protein